MSRADLGRAIDLLIDIEQAGGERGDREELRSVRRAIKVLNKQASKDVDRREEGQVSKLGQLPLNEHGFPIYPKGTPIAEVREHDRGQKLAFHCKEHPDAVWASKDPLVSNWFGAHHKEVCSHGYDLDTYVLAEDYSPTRNG